MEALKTGNAFARGLLFIVMQGRWISLQCVCGGDTQWPVQASDRAKNG